MLSLRLSDLMGFSCVDLLVQAIERTLNMRESSAAFYRCMNDKVMRQILDEMKVGAGVFSP